MRLAIALSMLSSLPAFAVTQDMVVQDLTVLPQATAAELISVTGKGVQIYRCQQQPGSPAWVLTAPEAKLYAKAGGHADEVLGTHEAGPTWRWNDGSAIIGKLQQKHPSPDGQSIPWLLLSATPAPDSKPDGKLAPVTYVRRSETQGGSAPATGCDSEHISAEIRIPYTATYTFYSSKTEQK